MHEAQVLHAQPSSRPSLRPFFKWSGGKSIDLPFIKPSFPAGFDRLVEPFAGGAAVSLALNPERIVLNDRSVGLAEFYASMKDEYARENISQHLARLDATRKQISATVGALPEAALMGVFSSPDLWVRQNAGKWLRGWPRPLDAVVLGEIIDQARSKAATHLPALMDSKQVQFTPEQCRQQLETGLQAGVYSGMRRMLNDQASSFDDPYWRQVAWLAVRTLCRMGMFRYDENGRFSVPYVGVQGNNVDFEPLAERLVDRDTADFFGRCQVENLDFQALFEKYNGFDAGDFLFLDPPWEEGATPYTQEFEFSMEDHKRLAALLDSAPARWMLIVRNAPAVRAVYEKQGRFLGLIDRPGPAQGLVVCNYPFEHAKGRIAPLAQETVDA